MNFKSGYFKNTLLNLNSDVKKTSYPKISCLKDQLSRSSVVICSVVYLDVSSIVKSSVVIQLFTTEEQTFELLRIELWMDNWTLDSDV